MRFSVLVISPSLYLGLDSCLFVAARPQPRFIWLPVFIRENKVLGLCCNGGIRSWETDQLWEGQCTDCQKSQRTQCSKREAELLASSCFFSCLVSDVSSSVFFIFTISFLKNNWSLPNVRFSCVAMFQLGLLSGWILYECTVCASSYVWETKMGNLFQRFLLGQILSFLLQN